MESVAVGLIVDSSIVIVAERRGNTVTQILEDWESVFGEVEIGISVITVLELTHGARRAKGEDRRQRRQAFLDELIRDVHVYAVTTEIARLAGSIAGDLAENGITVAVEDLLIGSTALSLGFGVATGNLRHFRHIPGLQVISG